MAAGDDAATKNQAARHVVRGGEPACDQHVHDSDAQRERHSGFKYSESFYVKGMKRMRDCHQKYAKI